MTDKRVDLEARLRPADANGWRETPTLKVLDGYYVDDPTRYRDGEPGRIYGPAKVKLMVAPDGARTLRVTDWGE